MKIFFVVLLFGGLLGCAGGGGRVEAEAGWGSVDERVERAGPTGALTPETELAGWRGERVHAQLVVRSGGEEIRDLTCTVGPFTGTGPEAAGAALEASVRARFVGYVLSDASVDPTGFCKKPAGEPILAADMLDDATQTTVPAGANQPVWITLDIPASAAPGSYSAPVTLRGRGFSKTLTLNLRVVDRLLPPPSEWAYHLDLWQHPAAVARVQNLEMWSDAHFEAMREVFLPLSEAGQKVITATLNKEPWNNQCFDPYADMIIWTRTEDGSWEYDFTVFDRWVEFMTDLGITGMINCYSMLPWNNMLHYRDAATGAFVDVQADPGSEEFRMMWEPFLPAFADHLRKRGWLGRVNIAMDERPADQMREMTSLLARAAPELGIAMADMHRLFRSYPDIRDVCTSIFDPISREDIAARRAAGRVTTFYVCCSSDWPNTFTFSAPAEAVYLSWHAAAMDYDGMLRWSYNSWPEDPLVDARFRSWASGDTFLVYPGGGSSIRFERLREGIQDFEKIRILRTLDPAAAALVDSALVEFRSGTPFDGWNTKLKQAKNLLNDEKKREL